MKTNFAKSLVAVAILALTSCGNKSVETGNQDVIHETKYNSSYINLQNEDFTKLGFEFGDSCNVYYSNGKSILDVPYYDGYYTRSDFPLVCGYQGYPHVQITINNGSDFWDKYELTEDDKVNVVLNEKGKYKTTQEAFSMHYQNEREQYPSDEVFANFRMVTTTNIASNRLYRGASPFNNNYNRAPYVDALLKEKQAKFILDLSDSEADIETYKQEYDLTNSYALQQDKVFLNMGSNFRLSATDDEAPEFDLLGAFIQSDYKVNLVRGLNEMINSSGPYYVHCVEGKDRTGFVCMLLEALCGASYEEMKKDYMVTYSNYFNIAEDSPKYEAVVDLRFNEFMEYLSDSKDIKDLSYVDFAKDYLRAGGMVDANIDKLIQCLTA